MQTAQSGAGTVTPSDAFDAYEEYLRAGSTGDYVRAHGLEKLPVDFAHDGASVLRWFLAGTGAR